MKHATKHNQIHNIYIFSFQPASKQRGNHTILFRTWTVNNNMNKIASTLKNNKDGNQKNPITVSILWRDTGWEINKQSWVSIKAHNMDEQSEKEKAR